MTKYRNNLPQLAGKLFLTDGGLETTLIFHDGLDLPCFAAFDLLRAQAGRDKLKDYFLPYIAIAKSGGHGFILESPTWRASTDWGRELGYSDEALAAANQDAVAILTELRETHETQTCPMVISGQVGPRGDGYDPGTAMSAEQAQSYHGVQINTFKDTAVDMVTAITMTNIPEAIGVTRAAQEAGLPIVISFTVETDGRLPTEEGLKDAIEAVDAATGNGPIYYMINCAHPSHFEGAVTGGEAWVKRIKGFRANASRMSHEELDNAEELDDGNPAEFGQEHAALRTHLPHANVFGGCCGTDHRHVEQVSISLA